MREWHCDNFRSGRREASVLIPKFYIECVMQIEAYFEGKRNYFSFKMNPKGIRIPTEGMKSLLIFPGKTRTYLEQSKILEMSK
jgi:methylated-DNA-[protein]-cysteine S-methyltransferase